MTDTKTTERSPIIAVMGHVDHGKSTLLDFIRKSNVVDGESGGITQHISAYEVSHKTSNGERKITFLDTPGHEAFSAIRTRGALVADVAVLVVAADDGVKPQTIEAFQSIKKAGIPFVVAINKIDKDGANVETTKASLAENEIYLEGYGGDVPNVAISALKGDGVDDLLDTILLVAEVEELTGDTSIPAEGFVVESHLDSKKGISATLIITNGTLEKGMFLVCTGSYTPVRYIENYIGEQVETASLSQPVAITGWNSLPQAGELFTVVETKQEAEKQASASIAEKQDEVQEDEETEGKLAIPLIIEADAHGSLDAVLQEIKKISLERVYPKVIYAGTGPITEGDIQLALTKENSLIVGFNVPVETRAKHMADRENISPQTFSIIYKLTEWLEEELERQSPVFDTEETTGQAKILKIFSKAKDKQVIGGRLEEGILKKGSRVKILRRDNEIGEGTIKGLQQNKSEVDTIAEGEFGTMIESKIEIAPGDHVRSVIIVKK